MTGPINPAFPSAVVVNSAGANRRLDLEWVMAGWRDRGKCHLLASQVVTDATLTFVKQTMTYESWDAFQRPGAFKPSRQLQAVIGDYVLIRADTYAECLAALLFGFQWRPDTIRAIRSADGMGRDPGPAAQTEPVVPCGRPAFHGSMLRCDQPYGHYPDTLHSQTVEWSDPDGDPPALTERLTP